MQTDTIKLPRLHPGQVQMNKEAKRYNVAAMGRRFGKSKFGIVKLLAGKRSLLEGYPAGWFAPSSRFVDEVWDEIIYRCKPVIENTNKQTGRIKFLGGGSLDFWAMGEDPNVARGRRYARVIIDEAAHIRYLKEAWERAVVPTLTDFQGEAWFISTPKGMNYFYELWQKGLSPQKHLDWSSWQMPTSINPHIKLEEIEAKRKDLPELVFKQEYLAEFVVFGAGLVKPEMIQYAVCPENLPVKLSVDLAISKKEGADFTAIVATSLSDKGVFYIREVCRGRWSFNETLSEIKRMAERYRPERIEIEDVQYQASVVEELLWTTALPVFGVRPDRDKVTRFQPVLARYEQGMVRHDPSVPSYFTDELLSFPEGEHDDMVDALSIAYIKGPEPRIRSL